MRIGSLAIWLGSTIKVPRNHGTMTPHIVTRTSASCHRGGLDVMAVKTVADPGAEVSLVEHFRKSDEIPDSQQTCLKL